MTQNQPKTKIFKRDKVIKKSSNPPVDIGPCKIKDICQSCHYINSDYKKSFKDKYEKAIEHLEKESSLKGVHLIKPEPSERSLAYRTHAKLAVRPFHKSANPTKTDSEERFAIGLFKPNTHQVVDISFCPLHKSSINDLIKNLRVELNNSTLQPYDEESHSGDLRYIAIRASHLTNELMLTFILNNDTHRNELRNIVNRLKNEGHQINSSHVNINPDQTNVIFGSLSKRLTGTDRLREKLCDFDFEIGPTSFFQVNPWQAEKIYRRIGQMAGIERSSGVAWDLYCGTGQISMILAQCGYRTLGIEGNPQAARDAQNNAIKNQIEPQPQFFSGKVEELYEQLPSWAHEPELIVVNPSRKGLSDEVKAFLFKTLKDLPGTRLIYMSCEMITLARDLNDLTDSKTIKLRQLEAFDMFPFTEKMEWLAVIA